ncbi:MAG: hypothetical protein JWL89_44 [Candidatus Saccharibacteria bacterium]|nr:hypothetical protein [Candidatus Saccharibacteria bacterium]
MSFESPDYHNANWDHFPDDAHLEVLKAVYQAEKVVSFNFAKNDVNALMFDKVPELVHDARQAAVDLHESDRGYAVGAAAFGYDSSEASPRIVKFVAANYKTHLHGQYEKGVDLENVPKLCAETDILIRADHRQIERISILVVAATVNLRRIQEVNDVPTTTLDPCDDCGDLLARSPLIDADTIIMTIGAGLNEHRIQRYPAYRKRSEDFRKTGLYDNRGITPYSDHVWGMKRTAYEIELQRSHIEHRTSHSDPDAEAARRFVAAEAMLKG